MPAASFFLYSVISAAIPLALRIFNERTVSPRQQQTFSI
jgi:hypothetical protein